MSTRLSCQSCILASKKLFCLIKVVFLDLPWRFTFLQENLEYIWPIFYFTGWWQILMCSANYNPFLLYRLTGKIRMLSANLSSTLLIYARSTSANLINTLGNTSIGCLWVIWFNLFCEFQPQSFLFSLPIFSQINSFSHQRF